MLTDWLNESTEMKQTLHSLPMLYKKSVRGTPQQWQIFVLGNTFYTEAGQVGGVITRSDPTACEEKNTGRANATTAEEQALAEAQSKWQKKIDSGYVQSLDDVDNESKFFKPMLAKKFEDEKHKINWSNGVIIQEKLDGIRAIITKDGATTRNGKQHVAIPHILKVLKPLFDEDPNLILDGEVYNHVLHDDFNKIASIVRKTKPTQEDLNESARLAQYHCYDVPRIGKLREKDPYNIRRHELVKLLEKHKLPDCIQLVSNIVVYGEDGVRAAHDAFVSDGYEGAIVRISDAPYENKRSDNLLKYKVFDDDEFIIEGFEEGKGNRANKAATIIIHTKDGVECKPNIKAPHSMLEYVWNNQKQFLGKTCTVRYFGLTPDKSLRFPRVIDIDRWAHE